MASMCRCKLGLEVLSEFISGLKSLQKLNLAGCSILESLPDSISGLCSLTLSQPWAASLPDGISGPVSLRRLNLAMCESLAHVPNGISALSSLRTLTFQQCPLSFLPDGTRA